jgi:hypothetical protein
VKVYREDLVKGTQPPAQCPPTAGVGGCPGCALLAPWVASVRVSWACWDCGSLLQPSERPSNGPSEPPCDPWRELEALAQLGPDLEGSAIPLEAPFHHENKHASSTTGRGRVGAQRKGVRPHDPNGDPADAGAYANRLASIDDATMHVAGTTRVANSNRPDRLDADPDTVAAALRALRRLDRLCATPQGRAHALVLLLVGYHMGAEARTFWWHATADDAVHGAGAFDRWMSTTRDLFGPDAEVSRPDPLGLDWRVATVCADDATRALWLRQGKMGVGAARMRGRMLVDAAVKAYHATPATPGAAPPRAPLPGAREAIAWATREADADIREAWAPDVTDRRESARRRLAQKTAELRAAGGER